MVLAKTMTIMNISVSVIIATCFTIKGISAMPRIVSWSANPNVVYYGETVKLQCTFQDIVAGAEVQWLKAHGNTGNGHPMLLLSTNENVTVDNDKYEIEKIEVERGTKYELSLKNLVNSDKDNYICQVKVPGISMTTWQGKIIGITKIERKCILKCHRNAYCSQPLGMCKCKTGYSGSGTMCLKRCTRRCHSKAFCLNGNCRCRSGYVGNGQRCTKTCSKRCHSKARCVNGRCQCRRGYRGNGIFCRRSRGRRSLLEAM